MKKFTFLCLMVGLLTSTTLISSVSVPEPVAKSKTDAAVAKEVVLDDVVATDALREFRSLSRVDKKMRIASAKTAIQEYKALKAAGTPSTNTLLLVILALLLPPLAVYLHEGQINGKFWLNLLLTLLFFIPGVIHALIVVLS